MKLKEQRTVRTVRDYALACANDHTLYENEGFAHIAEQLSPLLSETVVANVDGSGWQAYPNITVEVYR